MLGDGGESDRAMTDTVGDLGPGVPLVLAFTRGPVVLDSSGNTNFDAPGQGSNSFPSSGTPNKAVWWPVWAKQTVQDYRQFGVVHRGTCNILFMDGSVRGIKDANGDKLLNNGFPASGGFADNALEVPQDEIFSLYSVGAHSH